MPDFVLSPLDNRKKSNQPEHRLGRSSGLARSNSNNRSNVRVFI